MSAPRASRLDMIARLRREAKERRLTKKELCQLERAEGLEKAKAAKADGSWIGKWTR